MSDTGDGSRESLAARTAALVERLVPGAVRELHAYHVAESAGLIKLDAMENPYRWPRPVVEEWLRRLESAQPNRYPDPRPQALIARLQEVMGVPSGMQTMLGNGSDELIQLLVLALGGTDATVLAPDPSFAMYRINSVALGRRFVGVPLDARDFSLDVEAMLEAVRTHQPAIVFLAYPNNPTGNLFEREAVEAVIEQSPGVVVLDEAYGPFAKQSFLPELDRFANLLVMGTLSKLGFAGLRLGVLSGHPAWLEQLEKLRLPYNVNVLSQLSAEVALEHFDLFSEQTERILADREALHRELCGLNRITVYPSAANFILWRAPPGEGPALVQGLKDKGVLVRSFDGASPLLRDCVRVSVGTPEENRAFLQALRELL